MQLFRVVLYSLLSATGGVLVGVGSTSFLSIQIALTLLFLVGVGFEAYVTKHPAMMLPPAVFTAYAFINNMVSGIYYFAADLQSGTQFPVNDQSVIRGTWYTMVAVQALWIGFHVLPDGPFRVRGADGIRRVPQRLIYGLVAVSLFSFFLAVRMGVFGYTGAASGAASGAGLDQGNVGYVTYLRFGVNLGWLAIILIAAYEWEVPARRPLLYALVVGYFGIGILFGSKSTAVMPLLLLIVTLYGSGRKLRLRYFAVAGVAISASFAIIEPFRAYYQYAANQQADTRSVSELAGLYVTAQELVDQSEFNYVAGFVERQSTVTVLAKAIEFADNTGYHASEEWENLALSPLYGIIPRFIWQSKPLYNFGHWASVNIFGMAETTSTGITSQGYAYLVARLGGIVLFFFLFGLVQRALFNFLYLNRGFLPLYLFVYFDVGYPVTPWTFVAGNIQSLILMSPLLLILLYLARHQPVAAGAPEPAIA